MAAAGYNYREVRIVIEDELTHCYVYLEALGDCPMGVQGWHYKVFPPSWTSERIFKEQIRDAITWPLEQPKCWGEHK